MNEKKQNHCKRCGAFTKREKYCFHCEVALALDGATGGAISKGIIHEHKPNAPKVKLF